MTVHVEINASKCLGNGMCAAIVPSVFDVDNYGESSVTQPEAPDDLLESLTEAMDSCPAQAILVERRPA